MTLNTESYMKKIQINLNQNTYKQTVTHNNREVDKGGLFLKGDQERVS